MTKRDLRIEILGSVRLTVGGKTAVFRTDALRVLLAYLAAHQGQPQRRDTLAGLLSPDRPNKEALTYLRNRLTRLRKVIGNDAASPPYLDTDRKKIALRTGDDVQIDLIQFEQLLATVEGHPHRQLAGCPTCMAGLQTAVSLYRGELLAGLNFPSATWESWLIAQREHLQQRALAAMTRLREAWMVLGELTAVLDIAQRQLRLEPWLESAHRAIMQAHLYLNDRNAALAQFEQCQQLLWDELRVEPDVETVSLFEKIKTQDSELTSSFFLLSSSFPDNLPLQTTQFFGRESEQAEIVYRLVDPNYRLITLVGTGGIGKTRLAIEVGKQVKASFPDGVWFVPLDGVRGGAEPIKIAVGEAARLGQVAGSQQLTGEQTLALLRDKQLLLIFDNCEEVLEETSFIPEWLRRAPQIAILATSREPLNFQAESVVVLDGLPTGEGEMNAAEALFAERGRMARDDFAITAENLPHVRQICELVDGSPLGIGLAAAWVRRRSLLQILEEIGRSLDFLSTRQRDVDPRHRSMRAVFETSWQMLEPEEQAVLAALSVFPETFTAVAAQQISGTTQFNLDLLCEKSLLQQQIDPERYVMHSLLRQFGAEKLGDGVTAVSHAFVHYFYQYAHAHQDDYTQLQPEWRNFLAALTKAHRLEAWQVVLDFVQLLDEPWFRQIRFQDMREGLALAVEAATALQDQPALARMLLRLGEIEIELNDYEAAETHLANAMQYLMRQEDSLGIARGKYLYGRIKMEHAQDVQAIALLTKSRHIYEEEEDGLGVAKNLNMLALCQIKKHRDFQIAQDYLEKSLALQRKAPLTHNYIETLRHMARITGMFEAYEEAENFLDEAIAVSRQQNNLGEYAAVLFEQLWLNKKRGRYEEAVAFGVECLESFKKIGSLRWEALVLTQLGLLHQARKIFQPAETLIYEGLQIFHELGDAYEQAYSYYYLYKLYEEINNSEQGFVAKENAYRLNLELNDPQLIKLLNI